MPGLIYATLVALALLLTLAACATPGYRCPDCGRRFADPRALDVHALDHHLPTPEEVVGGHIRRGDFASVPGALDHWRAVRTKGIRA